VNEKAKIIENIVPASFACQSLQAIKQSPFFLYLFRQLFGNLTMVAIQMFFI